jgi:hypothetical protein
VRKLDYDGYDIFFALFGYVVLVFVQQALYPHGVESVVCLFSVLFIALLYTPHMAFHGAYGIWKGGKGGRVYDNDEVFSIFFKSASVKRAGSRI